MKLTAKQEQVLNSLKRDILEHDGMGSNEYEYKGWEVTEAYGNRVFLSSTVGMVNDKGTMAEIFCRPHRLIVIGPNGGTTLLNPATYDLKKQKMVSIRKRSGYWHTVHAQTLY